MKLEEDAVSIKSIKGTVLLLSILFVLTMLGCKENHVTNPPTQEFWKTIAFDFTDFNYFTNGKTIQNNYYATNCLGLVQFQEMNTYSTLGHNGISLGLDYKPLISKDFVFYYLNGDRNNILIQKIGEESDPGIILTPEMIDSRFHNYRFAMSYYKRELGAISDNNRFITWIHGLGDSLDYDYLVYADLAYTSQGIQITNKGFLTFAPPEDGINYWHLNLKGLISFNNNFYLSYYNGDISSFHRIIYPDLSYKDIPVSTGQCAQTFFTYRNLLWAQNASRELVFTSDFVNWQYYGSLNSFITEFRNIDNSVYVFLNDKIYCFGDSISSDALYQLPTENINTRSITSISKFGNDMVITTSNGIFYHDFVDVMKRKVLVSR